MTEKTIRSLIREICDELDVRRLGKIVLPTVLGAGLALAGCSDDSNGKTDTVTRMDAGRDGVGSPEGAYFAPDVYRKDRATVDLKKDSPMAAYGVPDLIKKVDVKADTGKKIDGLIGPLYAPPFTDAGPTPDYMAPDMK